MNYKPEYKDLPFRLIGLDDTVIYEGSKNSCMQLGPEHGFRYANNYYAYEEHDGDVAVYRAFILLDAIDPSYVIAAPWK